MNREHILLVNPATKQTQIWKEAVEGIGELEYQSRLAQEAYPHCIVVSVNADTFPDPLEAIDTIFSQLNLQDTSNSIDNKNKIIWFIPQSDILDRDFYNIEEYLDQISQNQASLLEKAWRIRFAIDGYNDDPRELFEIPEVCHWFLESMLSIGIPWFYLLEEPEQFQILLLACCDTQVISRPIISSKKTVSVQYNNRSQVLTWLEINRNNLVEFIQDKELPLEIGLSTLNRAKEMTKLLDLPLTFPLQTMMSKRYPDLGEYLYKHPQLKKQLLNQTISLVINHFELSRQPEGIEVTALMFFPLVSQTDRDIYSLTLRFFPEETDMDLLRHVLYTSWLSFQITGLGKYCQSQMRGKYRPLEVTWIDLEEIFYGI